MRSSSALISTTAMMVLMHLQLLPMIGGADLRGGSSSLQDEIGSNNDARRQLKSRPNSFLDPHRDVPNAPLDLSNFDAHEFLQSPIVGGRRSLAGSGNTGGGGNKPVVRPPYPDVDEPNHDSPDDDLHDDLGGKGKGNGGSRRRDCTCTVDEYGQKNCVCTSSHKPGKGSGSSKGSSKSGKGKGKGKRGGSYSDQNGIGGSPRAPAITKQFEFVMVREEVGTKDSEADFGLSSTIGLNGYVTALVQTGNGYSQGGSPIGTFRGACTVVTQATAELLCTYEIALSTENGDYGLGAILVNGPVQNGGENMLIVTAAEYDFGRYHGGVLKTLADENLPVLYAWLTLYGYEYDDH